MNWAIQELSRLLEQSISVDVDESDILNWVEKHFSPDDVFSKSTLESWALDNGFIIPE